VLIELVVFVIDIPREIVGAHLIIFREIGGGLGAHVLVLVLVHPVLGGLDIGLFDGLADSEVEVVR